MNSDTPRTDKACSTIYMTNGTHMEACDPEVCRQLERELNAANAELDKFEQDFEEYKRKYSIEDCV